MAIQGTNSTTWSVKAEGSWGAAFPSASGVGQQVPITGESLSLNKTLTQAETIRSDRARAGAAVNTSGVEGDVNFELAPVANTEGVALLMEGALTGTWAAADSETAGGASATQFTGLSIGHTVEKGQVIKCGSGSNAGVYQATAVSDTTVTVAGGGLTAAAGGAITGRRLDNGSTAKSFLVEKNFPGVDASSDFMAYNGVRVGGMGINLAAQQNVTGSFAFSGKSSQVSGSSVYSSTSAPASSNPFSATVNAGNVVVDGTVVNASSGGAVRSVSFTLNNNLRQTFQVGSSEASGVSPGFLDISGTLEVYYEEKALYDLLTAESPVSLMFSALDQTADKAVGFYFPKVYLSGGAANISGGNDDVVLSLNWTAVHDDTEAITARFSIA